MIGEKKYNYQKLSNSRNNATLDDYLTDEQKKKKANNTSNLLAAYTNPQQETATTLPYYQNENSSSASSSNTNNITLKDYYGSAQSSLEQNRQKQLEEAYVNNQLINKYFSESMAKQGLANTGIAELYKQKANNDYRNERANINSNYENNQLNLLENYYAKQKAEENEAQAKADSEKSENDQNILDWYTQLSGNIQAKIEELLDEETGKLSKEDYNSLYKYIEDNKENISSHYENLLKNYLDYYKMSDKEIEKYEAKKMGEEKIARDKFEQQIEQEYKDYYIKQNGYEPNNSTWKKIWNSVKNNKLFPWNWSD